MVIRHRSGCRTAAVPPSAPAEPDVGNKAIEIRKAQACTASPILQPGAVKPAVRHACSMPCAKPFASRPSYQPVPQPSSTAFVHPLAPSEALLVQPAYASVPARALNFTQNGSGPGVATRTSQRRGFALGREVLRRPALPLSGSWHQT